METKLHRRNIMAFKPTAPSYSGNGVAMWNAVDKNGKSYFKVKVLQGKVINCFQLEKK